MKYLKLFENSASLTAAESELIRPGVFHINDSSTTEYFGFQFGFRFYLESGSSDQYTYTINGKEYQTTTTKMSISSSEDRYQISLNDQITLKPDGTFTITNITIDPISTLFSLAFSIVKNNDFALRLPLEMQDYLTEHPDINVNDMTNEQTQDMLKAIGMCPIGNYAIVMFFGDASQLLGDDYSDLKPTATFKPLFGDEYLTLIAG